MLMRLDLALITEAAGRMVTGEAAGLAGEDRGDIKPLVMVYMPEMYNNKAYIYFTQNPTGCRMDQPIP